MLTIMSLMWRPRNLSNMFLECSALKQFSTTIERILKLINANITLNVKLFFFHIFPERSSLTKPEICHVDFILTLAKSKIYKSYMSNFSDTGTLKDPITTLRATLQKKIEKAYTFHCKVQNHPASFTDLWGPMAEIDEFLKMRILF